jgi:hypothetical protein
MSMTVNDSQSQSAKCTHTEAEAESESDTESKTKDKPKRERFKKPTVAEVAAYGATLSPPFLEAENFIDHYEANGWIRGKTSMKDWKATVRTWHRRDNSLSKSTDKFNQQDHGMVDPLPF